MRWSTAAVDAHKRSELSRQLGVSTAVATLLLQIGVDNPEDAHVFLQPRLRQLSDPFQLQNMEEVVLRLKKAMRERQSILIFGDYDVDGITSIT